MGYVCLSKSFFCPYLLFRIILIYLKSGIDASVSRS